jgi:hypothetical protein
MFRRAGVHEHGELRAVCRGRERRIVLCRMMDSPYEMQSARVSYYSKPEASQIVLCHEYEKRIQCKQALRSSCTCVSTQHGFTSTEIYTTINTPAYPVHHEHGSRQVWEHAAVENRQRARRKRVLVQRR